MTSKFVQPNYTTQVSSGTTYPLNIDAAITVLAEQAAQFAVSAQDTPNLTVAMRLGRLLLNDRTLVEVAAQNSAVLTAPATGSRRDIVYIDNSTGVIGVATGVESATPADPAIPVGKLPKARIRWTAGATSITGSMIDDLRHEPSPIEDLKLRRHKFIASNWDVVPPLTTSDDFPNHLYGVCWDPGFKAYVGVGQATGTAGYIITWSPSGFLFYSAEFSGNTKNVDLYGICYANELGGTLIAVGNSDGTDAYILTSTNGGQSWAEGANPNAGTLYKVAWNGSLAVAVGTAGGSDEYVITSPNGTTWTRRLMPGTPSSIRAVGWSPTLGLWVVAYASYLATSPDGVNWTERTNPMTVFPEEITWSPELSMFCMVGGNDAFDPQIATSTDGITWTLRTLPTELGARPNPTLYSVIWTGKIWLAAGRYNQTMYSVNGIDWNILEPGLQSNTWTIRSLAKGDSSIALVGTHLSTATAYNIVGPLVLNSVKDEF